MLVTADLHFESDQARPYETVLLGRPIPWAGWLPWLDAYRDARRFKPDVVVTEMLRDPRWRLLAGLAPRVRLVHDDKPHDHTHVAPWWNRAFFDRWDEKADATIVFCNYVADSLRAQGRAERPLYVAPLASDLDPRMVPEFATADRRENFLLVGRQKPYKNHDVVFAAWEAHTRSSQWEGDELVLLGGGEISRPLPPHARWNQAEFRYRDCIDELARAKGSIIHSRSASQSGVQVMGMQLGVPTLVSTAGGLPEYQPPGASITGIDDADGLARAFGELANPEEAVIQGKVAQEHYRKHYDSRVAARRLIEILQDVVDRT
jgi:glycosyltransferase involved in cell wall biosynthesis